MNAKGEFGKVWVQKSDFETDFKENGIELKTKFNSYKKTAEGVKVSLEKTPATVFVYWKDCGHCVRAKPEIVSLANKIKEEGKEYGVYAFDYEDETNHPFYKTLNVQGVPFIGFVDKSGIVKPYSGPRLATCKNQEFQDSCKSFWSELNK